MKSEHELQHRMKMQIGNTFVNVSLQEVVAHFLLLLWKKKKGFLGQESDKRYNFQRQRTHLGITWAPIYTMARLEVWLISLTHFNNGDGDLAKFSRLGAVPIPTRQAAPCCTRLWLQRCPRRRCPREVWQILPLRDCGKKERGSGRKGIIWL